mmetsp:Transcript_31732/g.66749  ORF Transcript_31732/g.66749 Transcript_31732/m.66749 type:complete len:350 (-) Transcript_31732:254-1303(-)
MPSSRNCSTASSVPIASFRSLFKGMAAPLSTAVFVNAIIFASYGSFSRLWENFFENSHHHEPYAHGTMAGEGAVFIGRGGHGVHEQIVDQKNGNIGNSSFRPDSEPASFRRRHAEQQTKNNGEPPNSSAGIETRLQNQNTLKVFMCGAAAGTVQAFVICPMEHIKCRLQVQSSAVNPVAAAPISSTHQLYRGPFDVCTSLVKNHGFFYGLYRGMFVTLWRETPAFGMYFATYDSIKERVEGILEAEDENHPIPSHAHAWAASALAGGISGAWTWAIIYPFDVIKSQIQTGPLESHLRKGMWTVAFDIVQEHGWKYMFRGLGVTLARAFPVNAIIFPVYEFVLIQLGDGD